MSDLSLPPLEMMPVESVGWAWPTPSLSNYPSPSVPLLPHPCAVEGLNGNAMRGRLSLFSPQTGQLHLLLSNQTKPLLLRTEQFRRLCLTEPLKCLTPAERVGDLIPTMTGLPFTVHFTDGHTWEGQTMGHREEPWGLFLFEPLDEEGSLRRWFVPNTAYREADIGLRLGEALVEIGRASCRERVLVAV